MPWAISSILTTTPGQTAVFAIAGAAAPRRIAISFNTAVIPGILYRGHLCLNRGITAPGFLGASVESVGPCYFDTVEYPILNTIPTNNVLFYHTRRLRQTLQFRLLVETA